MKPIRNRNKNNKTKKNSQNLNTNIHMNSFKTPAGTILAAADDSNIYLVSFDDSNVEKKRYPQICNKLNVSQTTRGKNELLTQLGKELKAYFNGTLKTFTVPIKTFGTPFQQTVWDKLQELPYGSTQTYSEFAKTLGCSASHARAIGNACGNNALLLLIPCHRLVATGSQGGYNSGTGRKEWLIDHEKKYSDTNIRF